MATEKDPLSNWDFGFSTVSEEELEQLTQQAVEDGVKETENRLRKEITEAEKTVQYYQEKLLVVEKMIMPLLNNLASNPEKSYIYWPNRQQKIAQFREMILDELRN
jgi:hypothetical protein